MYFLLIQDSILSLSFLQKRDEHPLPAIVMRPGTSGKFVGVEIKGSTINPTFGMISEDANLMIEECNFNSHISGGLLICNNQNANVRVSKCKFLNNLPNHIEVPKRNKS